MRIPTPVEVAALLDRRGVRGVLTPDAIVGSFDGPRVVEAEWSGDRLVALGRCAARVSDKFAVAFMIEDGLTVDHCELVERRLLDRYQELLRGGAAGPQRVLRVAALDTSVTTASARLVYPHERVVLTMRRDAGLEQSKNAQARRGEVVVRRAETTEVLCIRDSLSGADEVGYQLDDQRLSSMAHGGSVRAYVATVGGRSVGTSFVIEDGQAVQVIDIYTDRGARKQGVASAMLDELSENGERVVEVSVAGDNLAAQALYDSCGFETIDCVVERSNVAL